MENINPKTKKTWYTSHPWMILTKRQSQIIINKFNNLSINKPGQMADWANYVIIPFEGKINLGYPQGIKIYLQATKDTENKADKFDI